MLETINKERLQRPNALRKDPQRKKPPFFPLGLLLFSQDITVRVLPCCGKKKANLHDHMDTGLLHALRLAANTRNCFFCTSGFIHNRVNLLNRAAGKSISTRVLVFK